MSVFSPRSQKITFKLKKFFERRKLWVKMPDISRKPEVVIVKGQSDLIGTKMTRNGLSGTKVTLFELKWPLF